VNKENIITLARKKAGDTLCFQCPDKIKTECTKLNNGGMSCEALFEKYLEDGNERHKNKINR
jgi:hypothetical protein